MFVKYPNQLNYALDHINLISGKKGEFVAVMGRSGSGKTTLLNVTSIIDKIDSGNIYCADKEISTFSDKEATNFRKMILVLFSRLYAVRQSNH